MWQAEGRPVTSEPPPQKTAAPFVPQDRPELFVDKKQVVAVVEQGGACLVNALDASDFNATDTKGYARPGRIPGSLSVPASGLVDPTTGRSLSIPILRQRFSEVLSRPGRKVMYCGGGIAACADALALTLLGEQDVAVYDASLEEWAADPSLPMEVQEA
nr:rhodanese-like domain-containing protein [Rhizobium sp. ACO-34A]